MQLDRVDRELLGLMQRDNRRALRAYAEQLGISTPTCLRRLRRLEKHGVIERHAALLDPLRAGFGVMAYIEVSLVNPSGVKMAAFERRMQRNPLVLACAELAGHVDYLLTVVAHDMPHFSAFTRRELADDRDVRSFNSMMVLREAKSRAVLPLSGRGF